jgi:hypothetical protein
VDVGSVISAMGFAGFGSGRADAMAFAGEVRNRVFAERLRATGRKIFLPFGRTRRRFWILRAGRASFADRRRGQAHRTPQWGQRGFIRRMSGGTRPSRSTWRLKLFV